MTEKSNMFFTPTVQIHADDIRSVIIFSSHIFKPNERRPVMVVINTIHTFTGEEGLDAIGALYACKYYTAFQYSVVKGKYKELLRQEKLVYGETGG